MNRLPPEPLDAEERALTAQLPRVRGRSEPTPELDAQILAAARAAQAGPVSPRKPRRWQVPFALAASLCLAVGLAWQLRQTPSRHTQMDRARPVATAPATSAAAESTPEAGPIAAPARDSSAAPPPAPAAMPVAPAPVIQPRAAMEAARPSPAAPPDNPADAAPALPQARPAPEFAPPPPPPPAPAAAPPATIHAFLKVGVEFGLVFLALGPTLVLALRLAASVPKDAAQEKPADAQDRIATGERTDKPLDGRVVDDPGHE